MIQVRVGVSAVHVGGGITVQVVGVLYLRVGVKSRIDVGVSYANTVIVTGVTAWVQYVAVMSCHGFAKDDHVYVVNGYVVVRVAIARVDGGYESTVLYSVVYGGEVSWDANLGGSYAAFSQAVIVDGGAAVGRAYYTAAAVGFGDTSSTHMFVQQGGAVSGHATNCVRTSTVAHLLVLDLQGKVGAMGAGVARGDATTHGLGWVHHQHLLAVSGHLVTLAVQSGESHLVRSCLQAGPMIAILRIGGVANGHHHRDVIREEMRALPQGYSTVPQTGMGVHYDHSNTRRYW